jgi:hypothetical protein
MTITYTLDHVESTTESVDVEVAAKSEMTLQRTSVDPKTGEVTSVYVLASGDNAYPATVTYRSIVQSRNGAPSRRLSATFTTWATAVNDVSGETIKKPITGTFSATLPADMTVELADMDEFVGNCFSFLYPSVTAGVRSTSWLQKLQYGVPQVT